MPCPRAASPPNPRGGDVAGVSPQVPGADLREMMAALRRPAHLPYLPHCQASLGQLCLRWLFLGLMDFLGLLDFLRCT